MNAEQLKASLLQQAIEGKLVPQLDEEPPVEQIGEAPKDVPFAIPEKWKWVHFSAVAELLNGRAYKKEELLQYKSGYTPIIRVGNFFTNSKWYYSNLQLDSNKYCGNGDLLFAWSASFGPKIWNGGRAIYHYHIWKVVITKYIDKNWLYWWLSCKSDSLKKSGHGSTMIHVTKNGMEHELLALPPIEEQRRIVEKLNVLLPLVEEYGKAYDRLTHINKEFPSQLKASLLQQAIEGKLVPQLDEEPPVEQIGEAPKDVPFAIPEKWKWVLANEVFELISGRDLPKDEIIENYAEGSCPYITGASQINASTIIINRWTRNCVVKSQIGDLLLTCKGTVGKTAFNTIGDMHIARQIMALRVKNYIINNEYLKIFIDNISVQLSKEAKSMIPGIDRKTLLHKYVPLPPLEEQRRIVEKLNVLLPLVDQMSS